MATKKKPVKKPAPKKQASKSKTPAKKPAPKKAPAKAKKPAAAKKAPTRTWLADMVGDDYYPAHLVRKGQHLLELLAQRIAREAPKGEAVYVLTHETTEAFNALQEEFDEADSELETVAREAIADDVGFILDSLGYAVDLEEAIAPRDW